jgi:2-polyprenyl-6-methoxyphenol hydroxylase-like FAD-dependent oxidoreductase
MNTTIQQECEVAIIGAGPVGLFLTCRLLQLGISCLVLEKRMMPSPFSRAIGIHPPSLARLAQMGLAETFLADGVKVQTSRAFNERRCLGALSFASCPPPFNFVLTLPQYVSERILEEEVNRQSAGTLQRGWQVFRLKQNLIGVQLNAHQANGSHREIQARYVVGCDGKGSFVRNALGSQYIGATYPRSYMMGDFDDSANWTPEARLWLCSDGLVESFPLPGQLRRWVISIPRVQPPISPRLFHQVIKQRTQVELPAEPREGLHPFGVHHYLASPCAKGRIALAGDAAHVMPPFGGMGMNIGWMDAWDLADALHRVIKQKQPADILLTEYDRQISRRATRAIRRAEMNMNLGGPVRQPGLRDLLVLAGLHGPIKTFLPRLFSMQMGI